MKTFIAFALFAASMASAFPQYPGDQSVAVSQDTAGNYKIGVNVDGYTRDEESSNGVITGTYTFTDNFGKIQTIHYTAGKDGFHATGGVIPVQIQDSEEVARAKEEFFRAYNKAAAHA